MKFTELYKRADVPRTKKDLRVQLMLAYQLGKRDVLVKLAKEGRKVR